jgi:hypothetical protein
MFSCVKAHVGIYGNELADRLDKEAARSVGTIYEFDRIPKITLHHEAEEEDKQKWQVEWTTCYKAAATKQYFPFVRESLGTKINLIPKLAAVLTGHCKMRAYLHRFNLRDDAICICGQGDQTMDHRLFHCTKTNTQGEVLKQHINQQGNRPASKEELISKYRNSFSFFMESIDF